MNAPSTPPRENCVVYINSSRSALAGFRVWPSCVHAGYSRLFAVSLFLLSLSLSPRLPCCVRVSIFDGGVSKHLPAKCDQASRMLKIPECGLRAVQRARCGCEAAKRSSVVDDHASLVVKTLENIFLLEFRSCFLPEEDIYAHFFTPI